MSFVSFTLFTVLATIWVTSLWFDVQKQPRLRHTWWIYKLVMLTNLNFLLDVCYSILVILGYKSKKMKEIADFMHFTSVFPCAMIICGLFWGLYVIEPELVMPEWIRKLIPVWLNHVTHTFPVVYILLDTYFHKRTAPTKLTCCLLSAVLVLFYFAIIIIVKLHDGFWLYPILAMFAVEHFVLSYIAGFVGFYLLTRAACWINETLHKSQPAKTSETKKTGEKSRKAKKAD
ncbi:hypothetical protein CAEBREN_10445 [Caenorhabditis brenneri]|uniref:Uncharacterized protein n=1 Tax=Caenorhabditis brenneri TaxID=135651 RepID=G0N201_CAEBE|nr:hypothetical protein CAEBREN_10445 [Caenorhabditis brenneri]